MIYRASIISYLFVFTFIGFSLYQLSYIREDDQLEFQSLITQTKKTNMQEKFIKQIRKNIQKDIYYMENDKRYHSQITSSSSDIHLKQMKNKKITAVETLANIEFWLQERFDSKTQKVKYLTASHGKYFFPSHRFISDQVDLSFFHAKGEKFPTQTDPNEVFLKASAKHIYFELTQTGSSFRADYLRVRLPKLTGKDIKKRVLHAQSKKP